MKFGEKLKKIRTDRSLTQEEFGKLLGTSKQVISRYENGQRVPSLTIATEYSEKLNVPVQYLVDDDSDSESTYQSVEVRDTDDNIVVIDDETREIIDQLRKRPEMKVLFSVSKNATKDDIEKSVKIIEALKGEEGD